MIANTTSKSLMLGYFSDFLLNDRLKKPSCRIFLTLLILFWSPSLQGCNQSARWEIVEDQNPPAFRITGNQGVQWVWLFGPYDIDADSKKEVQLLWKIAPKEFEPMSKMQPVIYGRVPENWEQEFPEKTSIEPLVQNKWYVLGAITSRNHRFSLCFIVKDGEVQEYRKPEGCAR